MANFPQAREIPTGKVLLSDSPDRSEMARIQTIAEGFSARVRADIRLVWSSPGFEPAGSTCRWTNGYWAVRWEQFGATQGQRFLPTDAGEAQARARYEMLLTAADPYAA